MASTKGCHELILLQENKSFYKKFHQKVIIHLCCYYNTKVMTDCLCKCNLFSDCNRFLQIAQYFPITDKSKTEGIHVSFSMKKFNKR